MENGNHYHEDDDTMALNALEVQQHLTTEDQQERLAQLLDEIFPGTVWDDSVYKTAGRVLRAWAEFVPQENPPFNFTTFDSGGINQLISVKDIEFSSMCAHHLLPFYGVAHVGYLPNKLMVGLSKIPRLVDWMAMRPCTQEALTARIASWLKNELQAQGVAVVIESRHTCMACRGVRKHNASMVTSEMRGSFLTSGDARQEFLRVIGK